MLPAERKMTKDEPQRPLELLEVPNEKRERPRAVQTRKVGIFDESDERRGVAAHMIRVVDRIDERWSTHQGSAVALRKRAPLQWLIILRMHSHLDWEAPSDAADG